MSKINGEKHSLYNLYFKFGISRGAHEQGVLHMITLWINRQCVAQRWENNIDDLRKIARRRKTDYVIRDTKGHIIERGAYNG